MMNISISKKKANSLLVLFASFFLLLPIFVKAAGSARVTFNANNNVYLNDTVTVTVTVDNVNVSGDGITSIGGNISFDTSYLEYVSMTSIGPYNIDSNISANYKIGGMYNGYNGIKSTTNILRIVFKAKKTGSSTVSLINYKLTDGSGAISTSVVSKTINILPPLSSDNNLKSLSVSTGNLSPTFSANNTSYNVNVDNNISNINISAAANDAGATVSGTGNKNLNYGNNSFTISVKAANGSVKSYTVNVNRKDNRSSDANLKGISLNSGNLSFNSSIASYNIEVPYEIRELKITATPSDSKAKVTITGNNNLVAEENNVVKIKVTAENGTTKEYTINVKRGKDPNKVLSKNNYLKKLSTNTGLLSPTFNKDQIYYEIWLPFEIDKINLSGEVDDGKYGLLNIEGPDSLTVGSNKYVYKVTAEDGSIREYNIIVNRASDPTKNKSNNIFLKSLDIKDGVLSKRFDKNTTNYKYNGKYGKVKVTAETEDENSTVKIIYDKSDIYVIVMATNGDIGVYHLQNSNINIPLIIVTIFILSVIIYIVYRLMLSKNRVDKHRSRRKKNETIINQT